MTYEGCPEGMYPLDVHHETNYCDDFRELRAWAEAASDILNLPLSWYFADPDPEYDQNLPTFALVFHMPRKNSNWSVTTSKFDREEVQAWLDTWVRGEITKWFGWQE